MTRVAQIKHTGMFQRHIGLWCRQWPIYDNRKPNILVNDNGLIIVLTKVVAWSCIS